MTINQLKEKIRSTEGLFKTAFGMDIIFFFGTGSGYRKLRSEAPIGDIIEFFLNDFHEVMNSANSVNQDTIQK